MPPPESMADHGGGRCGTAGLLFWAVLAISISREAPTATILRARLNSDILSTNPGVRRDENTDTVLLHVVEGLVAYREDTSVGPLLASGWDVSPDGRRYTFHVRAGVRFHNGAPLTADDVVWSFHRYLDPATHWRCLREFDGGGYAKILTVEAVGPLTVAVTLDRASPLFLAELARVDCGETAILHRSSVAADGSWQVPIGTGPFRFAGWKRNQYIELSRFPAYAALPAPRDGNTGEKRALVDQIRFLVIPDSATAEAAFLRAELDVLDPVQPVELPELKRRPEVRLDIHAGTGVYAVLFQTRDPLLKDARLREAIAASLDIAGLARVVTRGTAPPNRSIVSAVTPYYSRAQAEVPARDLAKARRLAAEARYSGQTIRLIANHRDPAMFDIAVLVQAMALDAGIHIEIETLDWAAELERYTRGDYQAMAFAYSSRLDPVLALDAIIGDKAHDPRKVWDDPAARELLMEAKMNSDAAARQAALDKLQTLFLRDVPAVALFNYSEIVALHSNATGFMGWPGAQIRLWGVRVK